MKRTRAKTLMAAVSAASLVAVGAPLAAAGANAEPQQPSVQDRVDLRDPERARSHDEAVVKALRAEQAPDQSPAGRRTCADDSAAGDASEPRSQTAVSVFFPCLDAGNGGQPIGRKLGRNAASATTLEAVALAVTELAKGPSPSEEEAGYYMQLERRLAQPASIRLSDGLLTIDFAGSLANEPQGLSGSSGADGFLYAIRSTAFQFPDVQRIQLTLAGSCSGFWSILQRECEDLTRGAAL